MSECSNCRQYKFANHKCKPKYIITYEENGVTNGKGFGYTHEDAAMDWAERYDSKSDMFIANGCEPVVVVEDEEGVKKTLRITARATVEYSAYEEDS